ncbi:MAG: ribonuclease, partial [Actinomycetota bacterium]|nr:ribonuclease [Actinomycetota bacterium]
MTPPPTPDAAGVEPTFREPPADAAEPAADQPAEPPADQPAGPAPVPLTEPRDGVPAPLVAAADLAPVVEGLAAGSGPVAIDAERASGYRYGQAAYLVQLRRADIGTVLIDPRELPDLAALGAAIGSD